ncbi:MAG: hypothetical protein NVSMB9_07870 [Isosphaeraceae bacterium]
MFPVTRPYRQAAATLALVLLTVAPTLYVLTTAWAIRQPRHRHDVERQIGSLLGMQATVDGVSYPRPGEVVYQGVVLRQEEPSRKKSIELARATTLRLCRGDRELTLLAEGLRLRAESPGQAMAQIGSILQRSGVSNYERVSLTAPSCDLDLGSGVSPYRLTEVVGSFLSDPLAPSVRASFRVVSREGSSRCELVLTRDRKADPLHTTLALKTMEGLPPPARVLEPFFDVTSWLGPDARVDGALTLHQHGTKDWEAEFQGNLLDIELAALIGHRFPNHRMKGKARLAITSARWAERPGQGYGWVDAQGELSAGPGQVGYGLLHALKSEMQFRTSSKVARTVSAGVVDLDFRALAFSFAMSSNGEIRIRGGLGNEYADDVVLVSQTAPLAFAPRGTANVRGLIKTLFPVTSINHGVMVPLTEKSRLLLSLPVPPDLLGKSLGGN